MPDKDFYKEFNKPTKEEWRRVLGDAADTEFVFSDKLHTPVFIHESDAKRLHPLSHREQNDWQIISSIRAKDGPSANRLALQALKGGADGILLNISLTPLPSLRALFTGIRLDMIEVFFTTRKQDQKNFFRVAEAFANYVQDHTIITAGGGFALDPFKAMRLKREIETYQNFLAGALPGFVPFRLYMKRDIPPAEALGLLTRQLDKLLEKFAPTSIRELTDVLLPADTNIHRTIGLVRAFRLLWGRLADKRNHPVQPKLIVEPDTSKWKDDINTNRILTTVQYMGAAIGGADQIIVPDTGDDRFAARIFRNIQHIMKMEAFMDRVNDPAAGSKFYDELAARIADAAWAHYKAP